MNAPDIESIIKRGKDFAQLNHLEWNPDNIRTSLFSFFSGKGYDGKNFLISLLIFDCYQKSQAFIENMLILVPELANNIPFISQTVKTDYRLLEFFPKYKNHKVIKMALLAHQPELINQYNTWFNIKNLKKAINYNPLVYIYIPEEFKSNKDLVKAALKGSILYKKTEYNKKFGVFEEVPDIYQQDNSMIHIVLKNYPSIYSILDKKHKENNEITYRALTSIFYDEDSSYYGQMNNVIPYVMDNFYDDAKNILWVLNAFKENLENIRFNIDLSMSNFNIFINKACQLNHNFSAFSTQLQIKDFFNALITNHSNNLYKNDIYPTGIEEDALSFFKNSLQGLYKNFTSFLLFKKLNEQIPQKVTKEKNKTKI